MAIGAAFGGALGVTGHQRPRHLPQVRGDRPGRHDRIAAGHHRRAARRPEHRPADQDRAGRPAAGDVRPQRRMPRRHRRPLLAGRLLHDGLRGGPPGRRLHDAGVPAVRRLPGQRRRAVADSRTAEDLPQIEVEHPTAAERQRQRRRRRLPALQARRPPGAASGPFPARRAWSTASAAWRRKTSPATSATTRPTTSTWSRRGPRRSPTSPTTFPLWKSTGPTEGDLLVIGWGGTYGSIVDGRAASRSARDCKVAQAHLRYLNPMPQNTGEVLKRYKKVLVPELNTGQLLLLLRAKFLVDAVGLNKVQGRPFLVSEIEAEDRADVDSEHAMCRAGRRKPASAALCRAYAAHAALRSRSSSKKSAHVHRRHALPDPDRQGLGQRPGSPLVPRLRRLLDPGPDEEGAGRRWASRARRWCSSPASAAPAASRTT